ncbi:methyl-accepting chemotaxis protein [Jeotgalibacillus sp. R-1-5s-1]|uniref:methyl-accepting chemotaxis protein n=1 Tax=Jeotgalibacillus sp. R-1-5s-1 TaxID=2555897 RepID=UPI00106B25EC|nr:methyl-accepting chemotaxis protein [Jeotgalibacillus sp. R-1-5s-1]TFE01332.1 methyl-accepting chemotaxis protein [Jeotgalibacillus sp. R-1-5s-1]
MSIGRKILFSFLAIFLCIAGIVIFSVAGLFNIKNESSSIVNDAIPLSNAANNILTALVNQETGIRGYLVTGDEAFLEPYYAGQEQINSNLETINSLSANHPIMAGLINEAEPKIEAIQTFFESEIALVQAGEIEEARANIGDGKAAFDSYRETHQLIYEDTLKLTNDAWERTENQVSQSLLIIVAITVFALLITIAIYVYLTRAITNPVKRFIQTLQETSQENFTMNSKDEVKVLEASVTNLISNVKSTIETTKDSIIQVASSAEQLTASAEQTASATEHLAQLAQHNSEGAEVQLNKINDVSASLEKMVQVVEVINSDSIKMSDSTKMTNEQADKGIQSIQQVVNRMNDVKTAFSDMSMSINSLSNRSNEIGNILGLITDIADQTNLLALNAAIEAARAGVQGQGFAVVADEVRKLAEESRKSVDQISQMIHDIQMDTKKTVSLIDEGNVKVNEGVEATEVAEQSFGQISQSIKDVSSKVENVTLSIQDVEQLSIQVSILIESIQDVAVRNVGANQDSSAATEEQLATMEEISSSAQSLTHLSEGLQEAVSQFKL